MEQLALAWGPVRKTFTVAELSARIRGLLGDEFDDVWVAGEISGSKTVSSGHCYFTLKDQDAQLRCVCFRQSLRYLKFKPQDGMAVLARGHIDVYEARGEYQLLVEAIEPQGHGALQFAFEQLKKKLAAEGLFDPARKRPIPRLPQRIGIVTSPSGAVVRDITQILSRRFPGLHLRIYPALVQGEGSVEAVTRGIQYFSNSDWADVLIVARGGGSLEDLWTFNEEAVARAIAASTMPVISAVGHETDFTISDFVADLRAATPSAAAELVICPREQVIEQLSAIDHKLLQAMERQLLQARHALMERAQDAAFARMMDLIRQRQQKLDDLTYRLERGERQILERLRRQWETVSSAVRHYDARRVLAGIRGELEAVTAATAAAIRNQLLQNKVRLERMGRALEMLSPLAILERGYALVFDGTGRLVKDAAQVQAGQEISARLARGELRATVN